MLEKVVNSMKLPEIKWPIALIAFGLASTMLFAGYWLWQRSAVQGPLEEQLAAVSGVTAVELKNGRDEFSLKLSIKDDADFSLVGEEVNRVLEKAVPRQQIDITWEDTRNAQLTDVRAAVDLTLKEAQRRHEFVLMTDRIAQIAKQAGAAYRVGVGEQSIYVELRAGDNVLYDVLPIIQAGGEDR